MPEIQSNSVLTYKISSESKVLLLSYLNTKTYKEVKDAIMFIEQNDEIDAASFNTLIAYLSKMPWIEVDALMKILSDTTEKVTSETIN